MKATIVEIFKRLTKYDKSLGIIKNGVDNLYPERAERFILNSVTAKMSASVMASYLAGQGFGETDDAIIVDKKENTTLKKFSQQLAKSFSKHRGAFIHVSYDGNIAINGFKVLPYTDCRLGKKDDNNYNGKIVVYPDWENATKQKVKKEGQILDVYNPTKEVVQAQIDKAGNISKYKGQIWYVNLDEEYDYALSQADPVLNDCDSEAQSSVFKNRALRRGFFGKTLLITRPLAGGIEDYENDPAKLSEAESERDAFKDTVSDFMGAENVGGALVVEMDAADGDTLDDAIKVQNIESDIDDKLFEHTEKSVFQNILMAFNNIPMGLIRSDNSLFSTSGEAFKIMKETYQENTSLERSALGETVNELTNRLVKVTKSVDLIPLIDTEGQNGTANN